MHGCGEETHIRETRRAISIDEEQAAPIAEERERVEAETEGAELRMKEVEALLMLKN